MPTGAVKLCQVPAWRPALTPEREVHRCMILCEGGPAVLSLPEQWRLTLVPLNVLPESQVDKGSTKVCYC
jgi:hypothetical protein